MSLSRSSGSPKFGGFKTATATGTNTAVTITLSATSGQRHYLGGILWSYSADPTGGRLTSTGLDGDELDLDIPIGGPGPVGLPPLQGSVGTEVTVTLAAGGSGIAGKLSVWYATF